MTPPLDGSPLEEQIAQWRMYLRRRQAVNGPDVAELEGHLRDELAALTEAGLAGDEAFLVSVKRMGSLDALSREFAREHSERLWKQLVIATDAADDAPDTARTEALVVLGLAVAAAVAVKMPELFGVRLDPDAEVPMFYFRNATLFASRCSPSTSCGSGGWTLAAPCGWRSHSWPERCSPTPTHGRRLSSTTRPRSVTRRC